MSTDPAGPSDPADPGAPTRRESRPATRAITAGRRGSGRSLAPPIWASSTWSSTGLDDTHDRATAMRNTEFYARYGNPTVAAFEDAVAELEGAEAALAFASGMGAVAATVLALCSSGDHIVAQRDLYGGTLAFLDNTCRRLGIETTYVDPAVPNAFADAVEAGRTVLVMAETPSNPLLGIIDLDRLGEIRGPFTMVDSTFATPLGQNPLAHGVDLVVHSATKGIAGHNDATLGVIAGETEIIDTVWASAVLHGAVASPYDALNGLRGIRTLNARLAHQSAAAQMIAETLEAHPGITAVHYPGLESHPGHGLAARQMRQFGTVLSCRVAGGRERIAAMFARLELCRPATSLGGPETLVTHPATSANVSMDPAQRDAIGVTEDLMRISVGLEDPADVIADLIGALDTAQA
jgi:cystathionine beta-lyase/cystathionine gamma-synthase